MNIPFVNLSLQFQSLESELVAAFREIGRSGVYIMGDQLSQFEAEIASYCGVRYALGVSDGSNALFLSLKALGVGPGDEVITATNSFIATAWVIVACGAKPVLVDVAEDFNIDPVCVAAAITNKTRAIIPVHLTGRPAKMRELKSLAEKHNLWIVEDAAQSIGAKYNGHRVGSLGNCAGFSLHPLKNLGVYGDGGVITTDDVELYEKIKLLRNHGLVNRDKCEVWGFNSRLDTIQAEFARIKLRHLDRWNERCRAIATFYAARLESVVKVPPLASHEECVFHNFVIRTDKRDELVIHLESKGVQTRIHYPIPIHLQQAAKTLGYLEGSFPQAELDAKTMLSLPIYPELTDSEIEYVATSILEFFN
jgi:dTDP-4-amino-4,6-dideoxygalactose transaminase